MSFNIRATIATQINYAASHQKKQVIVKDIYIDEAEPGEYVLRVFSEPAFFFEFKQAISITGTTKSILTPTIAFNDSFYRTDLIEAQDGQITIELFDPDDPDTILGFHRENVHIQPYLHWDAYRFPDTLTAFMQPNDPLLLHVMKKAGEYAATAGESMCGYQCRSKEGVRRQAGYIYRALQDMNIHYLSAPASYDIGQKIRIPHQVLHEKSKQGTCLDLAILYASALEANSLNAILVLIRGHAFAAVWLEKKMFPKRMIKPSDLSATEWNSVMTQLVPVECTTFTDGRAIGFETATTIGKKNMEEIEYALDVEMARLCGENPVYTYTDEPICDNPEDNIASFIREEFSEETRSKIEQLRDKSMDLTVKSRLLNNASDALSICVETDTVPFLKAQESSDREKVSEEMASEIMSYLGKKSSGRKASASGKYKDKKIIFRELYSKSLHNVRETGKSNLYLALNELTWKKDSGKSCCAVMYLCPAEIYRNRRGELQLRVTQEGIFFNPALKVLLYQGYHFDSTQIKDSPGSEYEQQIRYLKFLIGDQKGWQIREGVVRLGLYSVPNEAVWNGLEDPSVASHEIVAGLLEGWMSWDNNVSGSGESKYENDTAIYALESDSSQNSIIEAAFKKKAQVVVGPAGDGKTQTVVNIMADAVRRGQKVLFVSEKAPAMEVAYEKLNEIFDGLFNLKVIYGKDKPVDIIRQIKNTLDYLETHTNDPASEDADEAKKKFRDCLKYLDDYYAFMTEKGTCGKSMEELINMYEKYSDCDLRLRLDDAIIDIPLSEAEEQLSVYGLVFEECDNASGKYKDYIRYDNLEGGGEKETLAAAQAALKRYRNLCQELRTFADLLDISISELGKKQVNELLISAKIIDRCPVLSNSVEKIHKKSDDEEEEYRQELIERLEDFMNTPGWLGLKNRQYKKCYDFLRKKYSISDAKRILKDFEEDPDTILNELDEGHDLGEAINQSNVAEQIRNYEKYVDDAQKGLRKLSKECRGAVRNALEDISSGRKEELREMSSVVLDSYTEYSAAQKIADSRITKNLEEFERQYPDTPRTALYEEWSEMRNIDANRSRSLYDSVVTEMNSKGYGKLIEQVEIASEYSDISRDDILNGFYKAWASAQIEKKRDEFESKDKFSYLLFKNKVTQLTEKERSVRNSLKQEIRRIQFRRMPDIREGVSNDHEFGILQRLVRKRKTAIRSFFEQAPNMLHLLFPCMIMDPSAVAEYIPSDFPKFDLVLIDEGSQMPLYNALIPIARSERCMIFGDEKQLQPIDTFKMRAEGEDEDIISGRDSILTAAYISSMPRKMLRFHYRSENESLIAFSNEHYYNGEIITFPSADTQIKGVSYTLVEDGVYDRKARVNRKEAEKVIGRIKELYENQKGKSNNTLGVITLNVYQRDLIQSLLMQEIQDSPRLGNKTDELVTVVNLEACQGKEWDYVIISPGFGIDEEGKFHRGFGALNQEYGANRLNVMLTRARKQIMVITSIEPHMLTNAKSTGVRDFREFLKYAQGETVLDKRIKDSRYRMTGLVNTIAKSLEESGFEVHTNIGSSDFKVDLAIVSKNDPNRYELGILIDHSKDDKSSIHDREVIYPKILESKGWKVYRLCGLNWVNDPRRELNQIIKAMEAK